MKLISTLLSLLVLTTMSVARADLNDTISTQKEDELEADETAMDIHDLEGEQKFAREQARAKEQINDAAIKRLKALQSQKASVSDKLKLDIMLSEARRKKAEGETAANNKQILALQAAIKNLQTSRDNSLRAAERAREAAKAGREMIQELKIRRAKAESENQQATLENKKAQADLAKLQAQSRRLQNPPN